MFTPRNALLAVLVGVTLAACSQTPQANAPQTPELATAAVPPGSEDPNFKKSLNGFGTPGGFATHMVTLPNHKALVVFSMGSPVPGEEMFIKVRRYNEDGELDRTFGGAGNIDANLRDTAGGSNKVIPQAVVVTPEGRIFIAATGSEPTFTDARIDRPIVFGLTPDGVLDPSFDGNGLLFPFSNTFSLDNNFIRPADLGYDAVTKKLTMGATIDPKSGNSFLWSYTVNVNQTGSFKENFIKEFGANLTFEKFRRLSGGELVIAAGITPASGGGIPRAYLVKQLDNGLVTGKAINVVGFETFVTGLRVDGNKLFLAGSAFTSSFNTQGYVARFNLDNLTKDAAFGSNGIRLVSKEVRDLAFSKGAGTAKKVLVAGTDGTDYMVARLSYNGQLDTAFGKTGVALVNFSNFFGEFANALSVDSKNRIWVGGLVKADGRNRAGIARLLP